MSIGFSLGRSGTAGSSLTFRGSNSSPIDPSILATLQTPVAQKTAADQTNATSTLPSAGGVALPPWLAGGADKNISELLQTYSSIPAAFDPTGQIKARNNAIAYNTSAGGQAANNAATEFANRASQSGGSALGAGVVKAQALMPVLAENASLKGQAADIAAKAHQDAASLAASVAATIGGLRDSYLKTLTSFSQGQQELQLSKYKTEQDVASQAAQRELGYAQTKADLYKANLAAQTQKDNEARLAATTVLNTSQPTGNYVTDNQGNVTSGGAAYNNIKRYGNARDSALAALGGMFG